MYYSKGTCEGLCTCSKSIYISALHSTPPHFPTALNPHTLPHCTTVHPHTHTHCTPPTHTHCTPPTHSPSLFRLPTSQMTHIPLHCRYKGQNDSPKLCPPQSFCGTVSGSLCVCWGRLVPQGVQSTYLCACACVCVCVCVRVRACVRVCVCRNHAAQHTVNWW